MSYMDIDGNQVDGNGRELEQPESSRPEATPQPRTDAHNKDLADLEQTMATHPAGGMERRAREFLKGIEYPEAEDVAAFAVSVAAYEVKRALEEACKAQCIYCHKGDRIVFDSGLGLEVHRNDTGIYHCQASAIRKLMGAEHE